MDLPTLLSTALGVGLLGLVGYDVYATILHSRAKGGPIGHNLNRRIWWLARKLAFRLSRPRRHLILNAIGPLLLPALVATFIFFLMLGYALIYWPRMPGSFNVDEKARTPSWIEAVYFSGITLTTLGYGDIAPRSTAMRLTALSEASAGFAFVSLAVTYLLTVTNALERKRTVALSFYHQAEQGRTPPVFSCTTSAGANSRDWKTSSPRRRATCKVCWKATSNTRSSIIFTRSRCTRACRACCFWCWKFAR